MQHPSDDPCHSNFVSKRDTCAKLYYSVGLQSRFLITSPSYSRAKAGFELDLIQLCQTGLLPRIHSYNVGNASIL